MDDFNAYFISNINLLKDELETKGFVQLIEEGTHKQWGKIRKENLGPAQI